jgi:programmed cell death 6-interacting protein
MFLFHVFDLISSVNASMNLPAAIEDLSGNKVPASVLEKSVKINEVGGVHAIEKLMQDLPELLTRNREILVEVGTFHQSFQFWTNF